VREPPVGFRECRRKTMRDFTKIDSFGSFGLAE